MQTWEYAQFAFRTGSGSNRYVVFSDGTSWDKIRESDFMKVLARLGAEGWELVGTAVPENPNWAREFYFKRPRMPEGSAA